MSQIANYGDARLPERFWSKVVPEPNSGCWLFVGKHNRNGYGTYGGTLAHRYAYRSLVADIPSGIECDHLCSPRNLTRRDSRCCCNPAHIELVDHLENVRRGAAKKTHCKRGHELAGDNLMVTVTGTRCLACYDMHEEVRRVAARKERMAKGPRNPKPKKTSGTCSRGHAMRFNGRRLMCPACFHIRYEARKSA